MGQTRMWRIGKGADYGCGIEVTDNMGNGFFFLDRETEPPTHRERERQTEREL